MRIGELLLLICGCTTSSAEAAGLFTYKIAPIVHFIDREVAGNWISSGEMCNPSFSS